MTTQNSDQKSVSRRGLFGAAGKATLTAGIIAPFRRLGGVAWAAETAKTYKKWVITKPVTDNKITTEHFKMLELPMPQIQQGQTLIKVKVINIHSGVRSRMGPKGSTKVGDTDMYNYGCAEVLQSRDRTFKEGDIIACQSGWQTHQVISSEDESIGYGPANELVKELNGTKSHWNYVFRPVITRMHTPDVLMDCFGTSGTTAYFGMRECGPIMPHDKVAVAGTTGSVGAVAAQIAKAKGAYVVGFGGGPERAKWVTDTLGVDKALDYRAKDLDEQLKAAFPNGIDVYSDGVGGPLTESIAKLMNPNSRFFSYGSSAAVYDDTPRVASGGAAGRLFGMTEAVEKIIKERNIKLEAWIVHVHYQDRIECENNLSQLINTGKLKAINIVVKGIENVPQGVISQYETNVYGKLQLQFA